MENVLKRGDYKMKIGRFIFLEFCWAVCVLHTTSDIHDIQFSFLSSLIVVKSCMMRWLACCVSQDNMAPKLSSTYVSVLWQKLFDFFSRVHHWKHKYLIVWAPCCPGKHNTPVTSSYRSLLLSSTIRKKTVCHECLMWCVVHILPNKIPKI
jgi:hypothetical protein